MVYLQIAEKEENFNFFMELRNDSISCQNSKRTSPYSEEEFRGVYDTYFQNIVPPLLGKEGDDKIGYVLFPNTKSSDCVEVSINISPQFRNKKLAGLFLLKSLRFVKNNYPEIAFINATIREENVASKRLFEGCGFQLFNQSQKLNHYSLNLKERNLVFHKRHTYIIAEMSCNHNQDINTAYALIDAAQKTGADAIKLQTYTPDTMTLDSKNPCFTDCLKGTLWEGKSLYELYSKAYTPWEWHQPLKEYANKRGLDLFSSPFDTTSVDFLETLDVPCYKIASFEITDHILIKKVAATKKPVIISSGMATFAELEEAVNLLKNNGCTDICMLKCTSAYPARKEDANLKTMQDMADKFGIPTGLSDHTLGIEVPITSVAMGGKVIEKHFKLVDDSGSEDDAFSLTPSEFTDMVNAVRLTENIMGSIKYRNQSELKSVQFRRSLFVVKDIKAGEQFTEENVKSIRPADGLHTRFYWDILGKSAVKDLEKGTPLTHEHY